MALATKQRIYVFTVWTVTLKEETISKLALTCR